MKNKVFLIFISVIIISCNNNQEKSTVSTEFLLGAPLMITVFEKGKEELLQQAFEKVRNIEQSMSISSKDYDTTPIMEINNHSQTINKDIQEKYLLDSQSAEVLSSAIHIAELTRGAFDPSIQPLVSLWGWGSGIEKVPDKNAISKTLKNVGWESLEIIEENNNQYLLMNGQQGIDVGGIAKGYAADLVKNFLIEHEISRAILDFGGNIIVLGNKPNDLPWKIGIQEPYKPTGTILASIATDASSIVTSGVYERYFEEDGKKYSHLLHPQTGYPVDNELLGVTIICKNSMVADGLSTGIFVLGLIQGLELIEELEYVEAVFLTKQKEIYISSGLHNKIDITNPEYELKTQF